MYPPFTRKKYCIYWRHGVDVIYWRHGVDVSDDVTTTKAIRRVNDKMF